MRAPRFLPRASGRPVRLAVALACAGLAGGALAETHETCVGFIDSVPATLTRQGVWCLRGDVSTGVTSGAAIEIAANNVTIDCNGFKIGGLAAGSATTANGIRATGRQNAVVRNCNVRGFLRGISLSGAGHLVEDNRLDGNRYVGIEASGDNNLVRGNRVFDTGGTTAFTPATSYGIFGTAIVLDNTVDGMDATQGSHVVGIRLLSAGQAARHNIVKNLVPRNGGEAVGVLAVTGAVVQDNFLYAGDAPTGTNGYGFRFGAICTGNTIHGFSTSHAGCTTASGNMP